MALVGDVLVATRSLIPDASQVLPPPTGFTSVQFVAVPTLPAGTYLVSVTLLNQWGETTATALSTVVVDATHGIQVSGALPVGATTLRVYYGITNINQSQDFTSLPAQVSTAGNALTPPTTNRAYLPDTDGAFTGAFTMYTWLNEALQKATDITGGILDVTGASSITNVGMYTLPGDWIKLNDGYFDGFNIYDANRSSVFRRNPITAISGSRVRVTISPKTVIELYYQPNRTAAVLTTTSGMTTTSTSVNYSVVSGALLTTLGLAQLSNAATAFAPEIVQYYSNTPSLGGLTRGLGGTQPQAWPSGTTVNELNIAFGGNRRAVKHKPGDATLTLLVPPGWPALLPRYLEARARQVEHEWKVAADLMKSFEDEMKQQQSAYKQIPAGPCQISTDYWDGTKGDTVGVGAGGNWILP